MEPSLKIFVAKIKIAQEKERQIAVKHNKMAKCNKTLEKNF